MKVICKCCHKSFDYDMYMGLCPKCGRVYRRGSGHYSAVEKDMLGDFHVHADEGGLNRGIHGVVYNQGSVSEKQILNAASNATINKEVQEASAMPGASTGGGAGVASSAAVIEQKIDNMRAANGQNYYGAYHKTRMNQGVNGKKNNTNGVAVAVFFIIIIISILASMFD
ncbi:MAG: hypothetical protein K6E27_00055 [Eubacterium sp.]|nr:hypothetical protein [Eubacterium sp.]